MGTPALGHGPCGTGAMRGHSTANRGAVQPCCTGSPRDAQPGPVRSHVHTGRTLLNKDTCTRWAVLTRPRLIPALPLATEHWDQPRLPRAARGTRHDPTVPAMPVLPIPVPARDAPDWKPLERAITAHKRALLSFLLNLLLAALQNPSPIKQLGANLICSTRTAAHCAMRGERQAPGPAEPGTDRGTSRSDTTRVPATPTSFPILLLLLRSWTHSGTGKR